jgi:lysophospholipase L1-like esterase
VCVLAGAAAAAACTDRQAPERQAFKPSSRPVASIMIRNPDGPVVILGASYARGWNLTLGGLPVLNQGREGQQSWELLARFESDVISASPRAVIIWGFINDIYRSPRQEIQRAQGRIRDSFQQMVALSKQHGIEPIVATEVTIRHRNTWRESVLSTIGSWLGRTGYQDYVNEHVLDTNRWLREFADQEGLLLLDLQPQLSRDDGVRRPEYAADDGSHISAAGYRALSEYASPVLHGHLVK